MAAVSDPSATASEALLAALRDPACYPHPARRVRVLTTHISWVLLAGRYAYKLKRPVRLGFLDYSTLARRRRACAAEVRLNRRFAPDLYLGVVPITREAGRLRVGGAGEPVEYAVRMRRLPQRAMLDRLLARGDVDEEQAAAIGRRVAAFHARAPRARARDPGGSATVRRNAEENFAQLRPFLGVTVTPAQDAALQAYTRAFLAARHDLLEARKAEGCVRDGHGDLRAANICLCRGIQLFDGIEFNRRFRLGDVAAEVAFLAMDFVAAGRPDLARAFIRAYAAAAPDPHLGVLLPFYFCYRAVVRAKVESLRLAQPDLTPRQRAAVARRARAYLALATHVAAPAPLLLLVTGLAGTGKTALAERLAAWLGWPAFHSDRVRKALAGLAPMAHRPAAFERGLYDPDTTNRTYEALLAAAEGALRQGRSVILDATFLERARRDAARARAAAPGAATAIVVCTAPEAVVVQRLAARAADPARESDADWAIYRAQQHRAERVAADEAPSLVLATDQPLTRAAQRVCRWLGRPGCLPTE